MVRRSSRMQYGCARHSGTADGGDWLSFAMPKRPAARSIVVLPFQNLTGDASREFFADGMKER